MRIFAFGCSFTNYWWPTWADILAHDSGCKFYNFGVMGTGNVSIFSRLVQADNKYKFSPLDKIYILWSGWHRHDKILDDGNWHQTGSVHVWHTKKWIKENWNITNDIMKNYVAIISANKMFDIEWQGHMSPIQVEDEHNLFDYDIPNKNCVFEKTEKYKNLKDHHPTINNHIDFLENTIGYKLKTETKTFFIDIDRKIKNIPVNEHLVDDPHNSTVRKLWKDEHGQWNKKILV